MRRLVICVVAALALGNFATLPAHAAYVYATSSGVDSADCGTLSPFKPCRTLKKAVERANAGDSIFLDSFGDFGPATITKSVNILSGKTGGSYSQSGRSCITVNGGPNDVVSLSRFTCDQGGAAQHGIQFNSGKALILDDVDIRGGTGAVCGVLFQPNAAATLSVQHSLVRTYGTTGGGGVCINPRNGKNATAILRDVTFESSRAGVRSTAAAASVVETFLDGVVIDNSSGGGIYSTGVNSLVHVKDSSITGNVAGLRSLTSGKIISVGGNVLVGNGADGNFTSTVAPQ